MEYFIKLIKRKHGKDVSGDVKAVQKLRREAERAKRSLSNQHQVRVEIESLFEGLDFSEPLTRARFEELNNDLFRKTMGPVKKAMEDAGLKKSQIDEIVLVGGSTRIPKVQALLKEYFDGKEPNKVRHPHDPSPPLNPSSPSSAAFVSLTKSTIPEMPLTNRVLTRTRLLLMVQPFRAVFFPEKVAMRRRIFFCLTWLLSPRASRLLVAS